MPKRFLNVQYSGITTRINATEFEDLSDVQDAIKAKFADDVPGSAARIQLYDQQGQHINKWALFNPLPQEYFDEDGLFLNIRTTPGNAMDIDVPQFDPVQYRSKENQYFPFFDAAIEKYLQELGEDALLARDDNIKRVNTIISRRHIEKYQPIICSTSRGMGKTAFMEAIGMQLVKPGLKNQLIMDALAYGRILSFDFASAAAENAIPSQEDIKTFFTRLMIYFLCRMFAGTQVDGIHFQEVSFNIIAVFSGTHGRFNEWKAACLQLEADRMMDEYIRLTNLAFGVNCSSPPVFLLDEIQGLCKPTTVQSKLMLGGQVVYHSFLSLLLTQLADKHKPVCICTGTNNGNIVNITEKSKILPQFISLTTLHNDGDPELFWSQRTKYLSKGSRIKAEIQGRDEDIIASLVCASYRIPRLLVLAHDAWFHHRTVSNLSDAISPLQAYEDAAATYYGEMMELLFNPCFTETDIAHILLCCGVRWKVRDIYSFVPGTKHQWNLLLNTSLVFPYQDNCFIIPFELMWKARTPTSREEGDYTRTKAAIEEICSSLVPNLDINNLFVSYDQLRQLSLYKLGICYESLFASSLAAKYYLRKLEQKNNHLQFLPIVKLYDIDREDTVLRRILSSISVDFSLGLDLPGKEAFVNSTNLPPAVVHNCKIQSAHHDIILPAKVQGPNGDVRLNIPVSCKASFDLSSDKTIQSQLKTSKQNDEPVHLLIWMYLGSEKREENYQGKAVFLNGDGCCNGLALDMFALTKKLISQNNKS
jgi:hypothetical protein